MSRLKIWIVLLVIAIPCYGHFDRTQKPLAELLPKSPKSPFDDDFATFVNLTMTDFKVPGLSIAVIDGDDTFAKGFGYATLPDVEATAETLWLGASTTKAFVGAALSQFIQNMTFPGVLEQGWKTPISSIIPGDFVLSDAWATKHVTLDDAVSHTTGLPRHDLSWQHSINGSHTSIQDIVRNLRNLHLTTEPRTIFQYCNIMYLALSHVIETLTNKPLKTTFKELIWSPLGMNSTYLSLQDARDSSHYLANGYSWDNTTQSYGIIAHDTLQESGAAGIITSVVDHAKWVRSLLYQTPPLSRAAHSDIRTPRVISRSNPAQGMDVALYGLGWQRTSFHGQTLFQHNGESLSFGTVIYWLPELHYAVVTMGNVVLQANMAGEIIARKLIEDVMGIDKGKRYNLEAEHKKELAAVWSRFDGAAEELYPSQPEEPTPPSTGLNNLVGAYHNTGYGQLVFKQLANRESNSLVLVAERPEMIYRYNVRLEHVYGDNWVAFFESDMRSLIPSQCFKAVFMIQRKVIALVIEMGDGTPGTKPFNVTFTKPAEIV